ncbi:hypothetical protein ACOSQ3_026951 [Xanthoceras sorbifolium]
MANEVSDQLEPWRDLEGKVVMVTGASSGLGRVFCLDLAKAGCRIVAAARRMEPLKSLCDEINNLISGEARSGRAVAVELDVCADGATIERSVHMAWEAFGRIDVLVNNAGVRGTVKNPLDLSEEEWDHVIRTNLTGSWLVSKYVCIRIRDANQGGSVINISSIVGLNRGQLPGAVAYASSKAGLNTMTKGEKFHKIIIQIWNIVLIQSYRYIPAQNLLSVIEIFCIKYQPSQSLPDLFLSRK